MAKSFNATMQHRWQRWRRLTARERRTLLQALALLPVVTAMVRLLPLAHLRRMLTREMRARKQGLTPARVAAVVEMVAIAADRGPTRAACLPRAVTACMILRREGIAADLCLGGARKNGKFAAHAWVEYEGEKFDVSRPPQNEFLPFDTPLAASRTRR